MKHLLIITLSFLLLSSPVIGKGTLPVSGGKGITLYKWKTSSGYVWKYFGDNRVHLKYVGEVENGVPNGLGIMTGLSGKIYVGEWRKGSCENIEVHKLICDYSMDPYRKTLKDPRCELSTKSLLVCENGKEIKRDKDGFRIVEE